MELGDKLRLARQEAGLSQRQLCGERITRNMLSQIEHGAAKPSMATLRYLAERLGKTVSYFLDEDALVLPNYAAVERAREAFRAGKWDEIPVALADYQSPDPVFDEEWKLLVIHGSLFAAEEAIAAGKEPYAAEILAQAEELGSTAAYYTEALARRVCLLKGRLKGAKLDELCNVLPSLDEELLLRAEAALKTGQWERCLRLLEAAEDRCSPRWNWLRGELHMAQEDFAGAAVCFRLAEDAYGEAVIGKLEVCYREMGDYQRAYDYACRQRSR